VLNLISWKHSFNRLNEEFEMVQKKKQALDNLYETGRISQSTHDSFNNDIDIVLKEIEKQQDALLNKMQKTTKELDDQIMILETLLANYEIQHAVGEIEEDNYQNEIHILNTGLDSAKRELEKVKEAVCQLTLNFEPKITEPINDNIIVEEEPLQAIPSTLENPEGPKEIKDDIAPTPEICIPQPNLTIDSAISEIAENETIPTIEIETPEQVDDSVQADVVPETVPEVLESDLSVDDSVQADVVPETVPETVPEVLESDLSVDDSVQADVVPETVPEDYEEQKQSDPAISNEEKISNEEMTTEDETDEWPQFVDEINFDDEPEIIQNEPLFLESANQIIEDTPEETIIDEQTTTNLQGINQTQKQIENQTSISETKENIENTEEY